MRESVSLDISKINSYVFPNIDKAYETMTSASTNAVNLKNNIPSSFSHKSTVSDVVNKINTLKSDINKVEKKLKTKVEQVEKIERKNEKEVNKLLKKASALNMLMPDINNIKTGAKTSKFKGDVVKNNVGKKLKDALFKTGAAIAKSVVSKLKKTKTNIINKMKFVGTKVYKGVKTVFSKISKSAKVTTDWIKKKFNETSEMLKSTGAYISEKAEVVKSFLVDKWDRRDEIIKRLGASIANTAVSLTKGIVKVVESFGDLLVILTSGLRTIKSAILDIINGIFKNKWDWKNTKEIWDTTKGVVSTDWTNMVYDSLYKTKALSKLNDLSYTPFKKDGIACQITEGLGYVAGIIGLTIATGGLGLGASSGVSMAMMSGLTGFGKYTEEEWNKNVLSINYLGEDLELKITYDKYQEISNLKVGESTTVIENIPLEDGSIQQLVFNITKNEDGTYTIVDNVGNAVTLNEIKESLTAKGLGVGLVKGAWEAGQWYVGSKIGTGQYSKVLSKIDDPVKRVLGRTGIRVGLDSLTAAVEVPFQSVVTMISEEKTYEEAWDEQGGWTSVISQVAIGSLASTLGEVFDIKKVTKSVKLLDALENEPKLLKKLGFLDGEKFKNLKNKVSNFLENRVEFKIKKLKGEKLKVFLETADSKGKLDYIVPKLDVEQMDGFVKYLDSTKNTEFLNKFNRSRERNLKNVELEKSIELEKVNVKVVDIDESRVYSSRYVSDSSSIRSDSIEYQAKNADYKVNTKKITEIDLKNLDDITLEKLEKIDDIDNTFFNYNGKKYTVVDIKNMLESNINEKNVLDDVDNKIVKEINSIEFDYGKFELSVAEKIKFGDLEGAANLIRELNSADLEVCLKNNSSYAEMNYIVKLLGDDYESVLKKISDEDLLYIFYKSGIKFNSDFVSKLSNSQLSVILQKSKSYDYENLFKLCNVDQLNFLIRDISIEDFENVVKSIYNYEIIFEILPIAEMYNKTNILINNKIYNGFKLEKILKLAIEKKVDIDFIFKYYDDSFFDREWGYSIDDDIKFDTVLNISDIFLREKIINISCKSSLFISYLIKQFENGQDIDLIIKSMDGSFLVKFLEKIDIGRFVEMIGQLDKSNYEYVVKNLEGSLKNKLALEYDLNDFYDEKTINLQNYFENNILQNFKNKFGMFVNDEKIKSLVGTIRFFTNERFKALNLDEHTLGFNNGNESVMNLTVDDFKIKCVISHESIHGLSVNDVIGLDGTYHNRRGFKIDGKNSGINETVTEYLNEIAMGDEYFTKVDKDGRFYCNYQDAGLRLKKLINNSVIDENKLIESYFKNDLSYLENEISSLAGKDTFDKMMKLFDDAIEYDELKENALKELDEIISKIILLK